MSTALPAALQKNAQLLQVGDQRITFGGACYCRLRTGYIFIGIGHAHSAQSGHFCSCFVAVQHILEQPWESRHVRFRNQCSRVGQVQSMPIIRVAQSNAGQIWTSALGAPQEGMIKN